MNTTIEKEKLEHYLDLTKAALEKVRVAAPEPSHLNRVSADFLNMIWSYYRDALYFYEHVDYVNSFAAVNYAYGWLDAGARLGLFEVSGDHRLFTLTE
ncbi:MAG: DUF357 domain-containing protein [Thermoplasmata archaeon]